MRSRVRSHPVASALAASAAAAIVWYGLASETGLIFHLMPAAPTIAGAWIVRLPDARPPRRRRLWIVVGGASLAAGMAVLLAGQGHPLDEPPITALVVVAGAVIGAWLLRRERPRVEWSEP